MTRRAWINILPVLTILCIVTGGLAVLSCNLASTGGTVLALVGAALLMVACATVVLQAVMAHAQRVSIESLAQNSMPGQGKDILLSVLLGSTQTGRDPSPAFDDLMRTFNEDLAHLQRSATKFDLFAADIHFSSRSLADLSTRQLDMLSSLRTSVIDFFNSQSSMHRALITIQDRIEANALLTAGLEAQARESRTELVGLRTQNQGVAAEAQKALKELASTDTAARELDSDIARLREVAVQESAQARKIAESLDKISEIVDLTHLLATNASIEAARAGSQGTGFGVIASEIRKLSTASHSALADIHAVLDAVLAGIHQSDRFTMQVSTSARRMGAALKSTSHTFETIGRDIGYLEKGLERFDSIFAQQIQGSLESAAAADDSAKALVRFTLSFNQSAASYKDIVEATGTSEDAAREAKKSARVLAQIASYLKAGGRDRNRVLKKYKVDHAAAINKPQRKETRQELVYNLEVFDHNNQVLGYLGDLSHSGLLLVANRNMLPGTHMILKVALPINSEGERQVVLKVQVRRVEEDSELYRTGCSLDSKDPQTMAQVTEILESLSLVNLTNTVATAAPNPQGFVQAKNGIAELEELAPAE